MSNSKGDSTRKDLAGELILCGFSSVPTNFVNNESTSGSVREELDRVLGFVPSAAKPSDVASCMELAVTVIVALKVCVDCVESIDRED